MKEQKRHPVQSINGTNHGFTMVELIVVLAVIAILASVAVFSIIGYIDRSRFNQNEQNGESIFQAVQTALERKKMNGGSEAWILDELLKKGSEDPYTADNCDKDTQGNSLDALYVSETFREFNTERNAAGESVHMRYSLTWTKGNSDGQNEVLKSLVGGYFYDTTILDATFTVEFDVEKTIGSDGKLHYDVNTYAVFYDNKRTGWDEASMNHQQCAVPYRAVDYREKTSLIGYYNGLNPAAVDSVYVPEIQSDDRLQMVEVTLKNDERLELSFGAVKGYEAIAGNGEYRIHYTAAVYDADTNEKLADLVLSETAMSGGYTGGAAPVDFKSKLSAWIGVHHDGDTGTITTNDGRAYSALCTEEELNVDGAKVHRSKASIESTALLYVHSGGDAFDFNKIKATDVDAVTDFYRVPVTISYVVDAYSTGETPGYLSYTIALDAMMNRATLYQIEQKKAPDKQFSSSITRFFADTRNLGKALAPRNIYVSMTAAADNFEDSALVAYNHGGILPESEEVKAVRAYDDPVYASEDGFLYNPAKVSRDKEDCAVVNTFFGDLGEGSFGSAKDSEAACITSFRHLYNMRFLEEYPGAVTYSVCRDLNWYEKKEDRYTSDVVVYSIADSEGLIGHSPVGNNRKYADEPVAVSWPALPVLSQNQTLKAVNNELTGSVSVIRNVEMRRGSFLGTDTGLGFIGENRGTVQNLRCENFCLTLDNVLDGVEDADVVAAVNYLVGKDRDGNTISSSGNDSRINRPNGADGKQLKQYAPIGGLVGVNKGRLGSVDTDILRMSNSIVLAGEWNGSAWSLYKDLGSTGGMVGKTDAGTITAGSLESTGKFAVSGYNNVGGLIGESSVGIDAYLVVNSDENKESAERAFYPGALVMGRASVGGAVGFMNGVSFAQTEPAITPSYDAEGVVTISGADSARYAVDVTLGENAYVWQYGGDNNSQGVGGAVGYISNHPGAKILSIRIRNAGTILTGANGGFNLGGTIGSLQGGAAKKIYITAENSGNIGTLDGVNAYGKPHGAGLGIGWTSANFGASGNVFVFDVKNSGKIYANVDKAADSGAGMAIGGVSKNDMITYYVRGINNGTIYATNNNGKESDYRSGVGGAFGYITSLNNSHVYVEHKENALVQGTSYNVGGAAGCVRFRSNGAGADDPATITVVLRDNATIKGGGANTGGVVGTMLGQGDNCILRTKVFGNNVRVSGTDSVGGVAGRAQQSGGGTGAKIVLQAAGGTAKLTVTGTGNNVGGAVGRVGTSNGDYRTEYTMLPASEDIIIIANGNNNVGGMIGYMGLYDFTNSNSRYNCATPEFSIRLNPASRIHASNQCAGGVIGFFDDDWDHQFASNIKAEFLPGAEAPVVEASGSGFGPNGTAGTGGAVGMIKACHFTGTVSSYLYTANAVRGIFYVGGTVGNLEIKSDAEMIRTVITVSDAVCGVRETGGSVGRIGNTVKINSIETYLGSENGTVVDITPIHVYARKNTDGGVISENRYRVGGSIGWMTGNASVQEAKTIVNTRSNLVVRDLISNDSSGTGGIVGYMDGNSSITSAMMDGCGNAMILDEITGYVGGVAGYLNANAQITDVRVNKPLKVTGTNFTGGVIGLMTEKTKVSAITMEAQTVSSDVTGTECVGGVIGSAEGTIENGVTSAMRITVNGTNNVGGIAGKVRNSGGIPSIISLGEIVVNGNNQIGGIVGLMENNSNIGKITADGNITVTGTDSQVGGLIGKITLNSHIGSDIITKAYITVSGKSQVGGVLGQYEGNGTIGTISAKNYLHVTATGENVGGVIGRMNTDTSITKIDVDLSGKDLVVSGWKQTGGVAGNVQGTIDEISVKTNVKVTGTSDNTGGIIGYMCNGGNVSILHPEIGINVNGAGSTGGVVGKMESGSKVDDIKLMMPEETFTVHGKDCTGGIVGFVMDSFIGKIDVEVKKVEVYCQSWSGGIVGLVKIQNRDKAEINAITANAEIQVQGGKNLGGVIGQVEKTGSSNGQASVKTITATKSITVQGSSERIGGIVGWISANSKVDTVKAELSDNVLNVKGSWHSGGVIGSVDGNVGDITVDAKIEVNGGNQTGGVIGYAGGKTESISASGSVNVNGSEYTGGVVGQAKGELPKLQPAVTAEVHGSKYVGGVIGGATDSASVGDIIVGKSVSVEGTGENVGGIVGISTVNTTIGDITANMPDVTNVTGTNYTGGVIGNAEGEIGAVVANASFVVRGGNYTGGVIGRAKGGVDSIRTGMDAKVSGSSRVGGVVGELSGKSSIRSIVTSTPEPADTDHTLVVTGTGNQVGGILGDIGHWDNGYRNNDNDAGSIGSIISAQAVEVNGKEDTGGIVGCIVRGSKVSEISATGTFTVNGDKNVGGWIGRVSYSTIGTSGKSFVVNNIGKVTAGNNGSATVGGTGALAGVVEEGGVIQSSAEGTLNPGSVIHGGFNTGGLIGFIRSGNVKGDMTMRYAGGQLISERANAGGVIGHYLEGNAENATFKTVIEHPYSMDNSGQMAISTIANNGLNPAVGGVIGQLGAESERSKVVKVEGMTLELKEDFAIYNQGNAVGGVLGRCETRNGQIGVLKIHSADSAHELKVTGAYDVGGIVGYVYGTVKDISVNNAWITVHAYSKDGNGGRAGGYIGCLDGNLGEEGEERTFIIKGIKDVSAVQSGAGGVIGATGKWNDGKAAIYANIELDLSGAVINCTAQGGGGIIGCIGVPGTQDDDHLATEIYGDLKVTVSNGTWIRGQESVGGVAGYARNDTVIHEQSTFAVYVKGNTAVEMTNQSTNGGGGGIIGINNGRFLGDTYVETASGAEYKISAPKGCAGGIVGINNGVFGRTSGAVYTVPAGEGTISLLANGGRTGAILGRNRGLSGLVKITDDGIEAAEDSDEVIRYHANIALDNYDSTYEGYVGMNDSNAVICRVVMGDDPETPEEETTPTPTEGVEEVTPSPMPTEGVEEATPSPTPTEGEEATPSPTPTEGEEATPSPTPIEGEEATPSPTPTEGAEETTPSPTPTEGEEEATTSPTPSEGAGEEATPSPTPTEEETTPTSSTAEGAEEESTPMLTEEEETTPAGEPSVTDAPEPSEAVPPEEVEEPAEDENVEDTGVPSGDNGAETTGASRE
ncbi:MAG: prepilin-type N-terminal cleavage/methylation domain-containing protein [Lachnospiraceae bacterium]|nr:prepilin-type N-terminal cleavage/methylation domain-containing protein [Lachnospiraceae bacterium]